MKKFLVSIASPATPGGTPYIIYAKSREEAYDQFKHELGGPLEYFVLRFFEIKD